ncbi:recombination protein RecR [Clostridium sp. 'deep sea']|uniref:recombination mediator RecR n=1 Tax=Clostridium sp. 'deep sea' TaxID=2779445 RepID=UPI001896A11C|nr:recombination mediator RecR [Clostridium sp. 'deep sea']QOR33629.1 recombination protein RecR [Clostridium sp. 'deep sea']
MTAKYPVALTRLIHHLMQLPGVGPKSAVRIAFHILNMPEQSVADLAEVMVNARNNIQMCKQCANLSEQDICSLCSDPNRNKNTICVVESPRDVNAIEATHEYNGLYHVLHGVISPLENVGPEELHVYQLLDRIDQESINEVIIATSPSVEGEATAMFLARLIKPLDIKVTRIAYGIPMGTDLEAVDEITLGKALQGRREIL